ncbi:MAG: YIP1 family protein [Paracoccaceae bacterium]
MPVTTDIGATYRGPGRVMERLLQAGQREDRALIFLMAFCVLAFVAQLPALSRRAHIEGLERDALMGGALLGSVFILPLIFYMLAALSHLVARAVGGRGTWYGARLALFWSLLASTPLLLLHGLVGGIIGEGPVLTGVGALWAVVFLWFWLSCLRRSEGARK